MPVLAGVPTILPEAGSTARAFHVPVALPNPAAGASAVYTPLEGYYEIITLAIAGFTSDAVGGNRALNLLISDPNGRSLVFLPPAAVQGPNTTLNYQWMLGFGNSLGSATSNQLLPLPEVILQPGYTFTMQNASPSAGDKITNALVYVQRYSTDAFQHDSLPQTVPTPLLL